MALIPLNLDDLSLKRTHLVSTGTVATGIVVGTALKRFMSVQQAQLAGQILVWSARGIQTLVAPQFEGSIAEKQLAKAVNFDARTIEGQIASNIVRDGAFTIAALVVVAGLSVLKGKPYVDSIGTAASQVFKHFNTAQGWPKLVGQLAKLGLIGGAASWITRNAINAVDVFSTNVDKTIRSFIVG